MTDAALAAIRELTDELSEARMSLNMRREELAHVLGVDDRTIYDWESGREFPLLDHLFEWARHLGRDLVLLGPDGRRLAPRMERRTGDTWARRWIRRLAMALRAQRKAQRRSVRSVAEEIGVIRISLDRWEHDVTFPRLRDAMLWVQALGCSLVLDVKSDHQVREG